MQGHNLPQGRSEWRYDRGEEISQINPEPFQVTAFYLSTEMAERAGVEWLEDEMISLFIGIILCNQIT